MLYHLTAHLIVRLLAKRTRHGTETTPTATTMATLALMGLPSGLPTAHHMLLPMVHHALDAGRTKHSTSDRVWRRASACDTLFAKVLELCRGAGSFQGVSALSGISGSIVSVYVSVLWICARSYKRMDNVGVIPKCSNIKWCHSTPSAWIHVCPALEKFLNDIQASITSGIVKWRPTILSSRIHGDALIQKRLDAIQVSVLSRSVNSCHLYSLRILFFRRVIDLVPLGWAGTTDKKEYFFFLKRKRRGPVGTAPSFLIILVEIGMDMGGTWFLTFIPS